MVFFSDSRRKPANLLPVPSVAESRFQLRAGDPLWFNSAKFSPTMTCSRDASSASTDSGLLATVGCDEACGFWGEGGGGVVRGDLQKGTPWTRLAATLK